MAGVTPDSTTAALAAGVPKESERSQAATISSAAPQSTTAALAGQVPLEKEGDLPGTFPETPSKEPEEFSVSPIPASSGVGNPIHLKPGEKVPESSSFNTNTVGSTVDLDGYHKDASAPEVPPKEPEQFSVNPIPASSGIGNPIHLKPGEKVPEPSSFNANTVESTVDLDGYHKDASAPFVGQSNTNQGTFGLPPTSNKNIIPESGLPVGESNFGTNTIQSAGPTSTTAALAGAVPLEPKRQTNSEAPVEGIPQRVKNSLTEADRPPEAAAHQAVVDEKKEVEKELQKNVPLEESAGTPAPTATAATAETAPAPLNPDSRPLSPRSTPPPEPTVTTGAKEVKTQSVSGPGAASTGAETAPTAQAQNGSAQKATQNGTTNGTAQSGTTRAEPTTTTSAGTAETKSSPKKKRNRVSGFFEKLKEKLK